MSKAAVQTPKIERCPIEGLSPDPANVRVHPQRNLDAIVSSLGRFGQQKPIVVNAEGVVIAGNGMLAAAKAMGWSHVNVVRTALVGQEAAAYAIADNRTADLAEWNPEGLAAALEKIKLEDPALLGACGYDADELQRMLDEIAVGLVDPDDIPEPPDEATTRRGDIYVLGEHRLMCGDSSSAEAVDWLLEGAPIHLVNTDPPYNVRVEPRSNNAIAAGLSSFTATTSGVQTRAARRGHEGNPCDPTKSQSARGKQDRERLHHQQFDKARNPDSRPTTRKMRAKDRPLANDFVSDEAFAEMLDAWFGNMSRVLLPGRGFYIWGGYANVANYPPALKKAGFYFSQAIIWHKQHPVLTRKDFMGDHEWCFYGWKEGAAHVYLGPNNVPDVWPVKKINPQSMVHLTEKPAELAVRAMSYSSRPGEHVLDLFGGSGSTLIAAEQTGRRAFLMELDAPYCDVIVERWENFTGRKAELRR